MMIDSYVLIILFSKNIYESSIVEKGRFDITYLTLIVEWVISYSYYFIWVIYIP